MYSMDKVKVELSEAELDMVICALKDKAFSSLNMYSPEVKHVEALRLRNLSTDLYLIASKLATARRDYLLANKAT